jgi:hypothetical protein
MIRFRVLDCGKRLFVCLSAGSSHEVTAELAKEIVLQAVIKSRGPNANLDCGEFVRFMMLVSCRSLLGGVDWVVLL